MPPIEHDIWGLFCLLIIPDSISIPWDPGDHGLLPFHNSGNQNRPKIRWLCIHQSAQFQLSGSPTVPPTQNRYTPKVVLVFISPCSPKEETCHDIGSYLHFYYLEFPSHKHSLSCNKRTLAFVSIYLVSLQAATVNGLFILFIRTVPTGPAVPVTTFLVSPWHAEGRISHYGEFQGSNFWAKSSLGKMGVSSSPYLTGVLRRWNVAACCVFIGPAKQHQIIDY